MANTPGFSAGSYDVSEKVSCCEVRLYQCPSFDLSNFNTLPSSWKSHNMLSQKGYVWSSSYRHSFEDVNTPFASLAVF